MFEGIQYTLTAPRNGYLSLPVAEKIARLIKDEFNSIAEKMNYRIDKGRPAVTGLSKDSFKGLIAFPSFYLKQIVDEGNFKSIKKEIKSNIGVDISVGKNGDITFSGTIKELGDQNISKMISNSEELNK